MDVCSPYPYPSPCPSPFPFLLPLPAFHERQLTPPISQSTTTPPHLPLLIPPLLALLDDPSAPLTLRGCTLLRTFLRTAPSPLLQRTGLGEVFHSALMPNLLYLPSLTPEEESLQLLGGVYPALLTLVRARFDGEGGGGRGGKGGRQKALDEVFRVGILKGYAYAGENVMVAAFLVGRMGELVREMGVESCKYLKVSGQQSFCIRF